MRVLIVESNSDLSDLWARHLNRMGAQVVVSAGHQSAIDVLSDRGVDVIILDLMIHDGAAFAIADFASYRHPESKVIFVTKSSFFSDGSIFQHCANACAFVPSATPPEDLAALVEHYAAPMAVSSRP